MKISSKSKSSKSDSIKSSSTSSDTSTKPTSKKGGCCCGAPSSYDELDIDINE